MRTLYPRYHAVRILFNSDESNRPAYIVRIILSVWRRKKANARCEVIVTMYVRAMDHIYRIFRRMTLK